MHRENAAWATPTTNEVTPPVPFGEPGQRVLILLNGGRMSRNWLLGLGASAARTGVGHLFAEMDNLRAGLVSSFESTIQQIDRIIREQHISLVVSYTHNGGDISAGKDPLTACRTVWEVNGVAHAMLWADHPQWAHDRFGLRPGSQPMLRNPNVHHFFKSTGHAMELERMLGWANCNELPLAVDVDRLRPVETKGEREFDVVAIYGGKPEMNPSLKPFLEQDEPDIEGILDAVTRRVVDECAAILTADAPAALHGELSAWVGRLVELKRTRCTLASARHFQRLAAEFPSAARWLAANYPTYFKLSASMWKFRGWEREFIPAYLAKYFRVAVLGGDWSALGCLRGGGDSDAWVDFDQMPAAYARGRVALNLTAGWDEEGIPAKTFETAAGAAAMVHNASLGIEQFFEPGEEIEVFSTPFQARQQVQRLLDSPTSRHEMAMAARGRCERNHSWDDRLMNIIAASGRHAASFRV